MADQSRNDADRGVAVPVPLSRLLSALTHEFTRAAAGHHATVAYWKQLYADNPILAETEPACMRITSAKIQVPFAIAEAQSRPAQSPQISRDTIFAALPKITPDSARQKAAALIHQELTTHDRGRLDSSTLLQDLREATRRHAPGLELELDAASVSNLQRLYATLPKAEADLNVIYRAEDLARINPDTVLRVELELHLE